MALIIDLAPEVEGRLKLEANRRGLPPPEYVRRLIEERLSMEPPALTAEERARRVEAVHGKYAHLKTSSEAFALRKQEEIDLEDRPR